jgi:D-sedoheptulose 7-phosphate isomerase
MNSTDSFLVANASGAAFATSYLAYCADLLRRIDTTALGRFIDELLAARDRDSQIFFIGNGGSAATASHFANDVAIGTRCPWMPFRAIALTDNAAIMTAVANDNGYEHVFTKQLEALMRPNDVLVAISASGNSPNLVGAVKYAQAHGGVCIALTGFDGGELAKICDVNVEVATPKGEYGPVEAIHGVLIHLVGNYLVDVVQREVGAIAR